MCWGLNSHYFHIVGDDHEPNNVVIRIPYYRWDDHPQYREFRPWHIWFWSFPKSNDSMKKTSMKWTRIVHSDDFDLFQEHLFFMENLRVHPADNFFPRSFDVFLCFGIHKSWNQPACSIIILEKGKIFGVEQTLKVIIGPHAERPPHPSFSLHPSAVQHRDLVWSFTSLS